MLRIPSRQSWAPESMLRIAEIGLLGALVLGVLAFGGTERLSFSLVQSLLLGLGLLLLATSPAAPGNKRGPLMMVPFFVVGVVLLQLAPLPVSLVQQVRRDGNWLPRGSLAPISLAPYETVSHLLLLLTFLAAFYLTRVLCQDRERMKRLVFALLALGSFEAFYGLVQYLTGWQQIFTYVKSVNLNEATGTYINRNHYAALLGMILPFALGMAFYHVGQPRPAARRTAARLRTLIAETEVQKLICWLFLALVLFAALVFSRSRMGLLAAMAAIVTMGAVISASPRGRRRGWAGVVLFLAAACGLVVWIGLAPVVARFQTLPGEYAGSDSGRGAIWLDTVRLIRQHPLLGSGLGTFPLAYPAAQTTFLGKRVNHAHNDYLEITSDLGLLGAVILFGSIFYLLVRLIRCFCATGGHPRHAMALSCAGSISTILWHSLTDFNLYIPGNALVFSCVLGMGNSILQEQDTRGRC